MPATITVTGTAGAGLTVTASQFLNIINFSIDTVNNIITMFDSSGRMTQISIAAAATITATKSGNTYTLVIS